MISLTRGQAILVYVLSLLFLGYVISSKPKYLLDQKNKKDLSPLSTTLAFVVANLILYLIVGWGAKALARRKGGGLGGPPGGPGGYGPTPEFTPTSPDSPPSSDFA